MDRYERTHNENNNKMMTRIAAFPIIWEQFFFCLKRGGLWNLRTETGIRDPPKKE